MMRPVYIEWLDHASTQGWVHPCELHDEDNPRLHPVRNFTFGFIIDEDKHAIYLSHTWTETGLCCDPIVIMKSLIVKRKRVKP